MQVFFKMSSRISSVPQHILQLMDDMDSDFIDEDDFDGYLYVKNNNI